METRTLSLYIYQRKKGHFSDFGMPAGNMNRRINNPPQLTNPPHKTGFHLRFPKPFNHPRGTWTVSRRQNELTEK
jgi:hypothetical protein